MPVYNALPHLDQAVESILHQTVADFEFVILDDASTDGSTERLRYWASRDPRIRLVEVEKNLGPAMSSERAAREARAPIVARMDADDISCPTRLEEQLKVLDTHPDVGVVGGLWDVIDANGREIRKPEPWRILRRSVFPPFGNGPMMYRREVFESVGGYRRECEFWEDHDLVLRMAAVTKIMVIPHAIYKVRQSTTSTRIVSGQERLERAVDLMYRSSDRLWHNDGYDEVVKSARPPDAKVDPRVFISLGSLVLWGGGRPRLFRRLLKRGELSFNFRATSALVWTAWASLSPATLRLFLRGLLIARNRFAVTMLHSDEPVLWKPGTGASAD
jgi:glycosyltransferase involved in cell wall biosynthesis